MRPTWLIATALAMAIFAVAFGSAASLNLTSNRLGMATVATPRCTTAALSVLENLSGNNVASVTVSSLPSTCGGGTLLVTLNSGASTGSGSAAVPAGGGSVTVTLGSTPAVTAAGEIDLVVVGP